MTNIIPPKLEDLKKNRKPVINVNEEQRSKVKKSEWLALFVTDKVGTIGFFMVVALWTLAWLVWNTIGPAGWIFDPFPAFVLWLFISNFIQLVFLPLIMVGQNLQGRHAEARAENDFNINVKAEAEIEAILLHLENQGDMMLQILNHLEKGNEN